MHIFFIQTSFSLFSNTTFYLFYCFFCSMPLSTLIEEWNKKYESERIHKRTSVGEKKLKSLCHLVNIFWFSIRIHSFSLFAHFSPLSYSLMSNSSNRRRKNNYIVPKKAYSWHIRVVCCNNIFKRISFTLSRTSFH